METDLGFILVLGILLLRADVGFGQSVFLLWDAAKSWFVLFKRNHRGGPVFQSVPQQRETPSITMECFMDERRSSGQKVWLLWVLATLWVGLDLHHFRKKKGAMKVMECCSDASVMWDTNIWSKVWRFRNVFSGVYVGVISKNPLIKMTVVPSLWIRLECWHLALHIHTFRQK